MTIRVETEVTDPALDFDYEKIAEQYGVDFLRAADYVSSSEEDQEHMNANSHQIFASVIAEHLQSI